MDDPFDAVFKDLKDQIFEYVNNNFQSSSYMNTDNSLIEKDIEDTFEDLENSLSALADVEKKQEREEKLKVLRKKYYDFKSTKMGNNIESIMETRDDLHNEVNEQDMKFNQLENSMMIEQDQQLDNIAKTMQTLNKQANMMTMELEDHMNLMGDLENDMDMAGDKIGESSKRLDWIYKTNRLVGYNDCFISLLIVVLIILLVLLIAI